MCTSTYAWNTCILCSLLSTYTKYIQPQGNAAKWRVVCSSIHHTLCDTWLSIIKSLVSMSTSLFTMFLQCTWPLSSWARPLRGICNRTVGLCKWYTDSREIAHGSFNIVFPRMSLLNKFPICLGWAWWKWAGVYVIWVQMNLCLSCDLSWVWFPGLSCLGCWVSEWIASVYGTQPSSHVCIYFM